MREPERREGRIKEGSRERERRRGGEVKGTMEKTEEKREKARWGGKGELRKE